MKIVPDFQTMRVGIASLVSLRHGMVVVGLLQLPLLIIRLRVLPSVGLGVMRGMLGMVVVVHYLQRREIPASLHLTLLTTASPSKPVT